jgi:uncharacterized protein involved in exopolysaccharide biosynthesis
MSSGSGEVVVGADTERSAFDLELVARFARRHWRTVAVCSVGLATLFIGAAIVSGREYVSSASFTSEGSAKAGIASLAGQFGVTIPTSNRSETPEFYIDLLRSRVILRPVVESSFLVAEKGGERISFYDLFRIRAGSAEGRAQRAVRALSSRVTASAARTTGVVRVQVKSKWPSVSKAILESLISGAHEFNLRARRSQASEERKFVEGRLQLADVALRAAEDSLQLFLKANRQYQSSPELQFAYQRRARAVAVQQQLYTSLAVSYEEVRAREVRDTPVITIVEPPLLPVMPESRHLLALLAAGLFLGAGLGVLVAHLREGRAA